MWKRQSIAKYNCYSTMAKGLGEGDRNSCSQHQPARAKNLTCQKNLKLSRCNTALPGVLSGVVHRIIVYLGNWIFYVVAEYCNAVLGVHYNTYRCVIAGNIRVNTILFSKLELWWTRLSMTKPSKFGRLCIGGWSIELNTWPWRRERRSVLCNRGLSWMWPGILDSLWLNKKK